MLFRVSSSEVFVCGTLHFLPDGAQLPPSLFDAISTADDCVFESDLDNAREPEFARYADDDSLDAHISPELFVATSKICNSLGVAEVLPHLKPWWVGLVIGVHLILRAGNRLESGADRQLWDAAKRAGKCPFVLESIDALRAFDAAPLQEQISRLEFIVSNPDRAAIQFDRLHAAWHLGDTVALAHELQMLLELSPMTFDGLVHQRNRQWLPQILSAIERGRSALFVVGALHLAGVHSLQRLLEEHGHSLVPA